jgi:chromosome segregation ATPase
MSSKRQDLYLQWGQLAGKRKMLEVELERVNAEITTIRKRLDELKEKEAQLQGNSITT